MNINLVGGDPYGGPARIDQFFLWRPFAHSTNGTAPVQGLIHIGASHPSRSRPWRRVRLQRGKKAGRMNDETPPP